jgi:MFS family permease
VKRNIERLYAFAFFDQFMIVIPLFVPYLATQGIGMAQFMELQASSRSSSWRARCPPAASDRWGRKTVLLLGAALKAASFSLLPLWSTYDGFLVYHLTMGIALSMISGGDVALLYESHLAAGGDSARATSVLGNARLAGQAGAAASALVGGAVVAFFYGTCYGRMRCSAGSPCSSCSASPSRLRASRARNGRRSRQGNPGRGDHARSRDAARLPQPGRRGIAGC